MSQDAKDREILRLRSALSDMLYEFESDHDAVKDDEHTEEEAADNDSCTYCRIIAEAHAALKADYRVTPAPKADKPQDLACELMAPNGKRIVSIIESVLVDYDITRIARDADGKIRFKYCENQDDDVSWESAEPTTDENGEYTFVDEENNYWKGSQLIKSTYPDDDYDSDEDDWYGDDDDGEEENQEGEETEGT